MNSPTSPSATEPRARPAPAPAAASHAILFDVGYTLLDESARLRAALAWLAAEAHPPLAGMSPADLHHCYLKTCAAPDAASPSLFIQMMMELGLTAAQARELRCRMNWDGVALAPYADTLPALRRLQDAGLRLGVLANQPASAHDDLAAANLLPLLDNIWLSDAVGLAKPNPAFFQLAIDAWRLPPRRIAYVGDRPDNDVRPAKALGLHTVLLKVGPHASQAPRNAAETPDFAAHSLTDAAEHLIRWATGAATAAPTDTPATP